MDVVKGPDSERDAIIRRMIETYQTPLMRMCYLYLHDVHLVEDAATLCGMFAE